MKLLVCFVFAILTLARGEDAKEKRSLFNFGIGYNFHLGDPHVKVGHHVPDAYAASGHHLPYEYYHHQKDLGIHAQGFAGLHIGAPPTDNHISHKPIPVVRVAHPDKTRYETVKVILVPQIQIAPIAQQAPILPMMSAQIQSAPAKQPSAPVPPMVPMVQVATPVQNQPPTQPQIRPPVSTPTPILPMMIARLQTAPAAQPPIPVPQIQMAPKGQALPQVQNQPQMQTPVSMATQILPMMIAQIQAAPAMPSYITPATKTIAAYTISLPQAASVGFQPVSSLVGKRK